MLYDALLIPNIGVEMYLGKRWSVAANWMYGWWNYHAISDLTHHDATLFKGVGCYEEKEKTLIYSVINSEAKRELIPMIRGIDEHAFINVVKTEELDGRFHDIPHD